MEDKLYQNHFGALNNIKSSGGWMKFLGVLMYVGAFFMLLVAILAIVGSSIFFDALEKSRAFAALAFAPVAIGFVFLLVAATLVLLGYWIHSSGSCATQIGPMQVESNLVQYASNFKKYLVFSFVMGILSLLGSLITLIALF